MTATHLRGQVWETYSRKGLLTVELLEDVDMAEDGFFAVTIIEGRAKYLSMENNLRQKYDGLGTRGDTINMRTILTTFKKRREDLEAKIAEDRARWCDKEPV